MPRPPVERILSAAIPQRGFVPADGSAGEVVLSLDEAEALRLADLDGLYQQAAAQRMGVSRQTFGRIVESAHRKMADALLNGKTLRVEGGTVSIASGAARPPVLALPTGEDGRVEEHFGRSSTFTIFFAAADGSIGSERSFDSRGESGCKPALMAALAAEGVTHFLVGRIGEGALRVAGAHGIAVLRGAVGPVREVAEAFLRGELHDTGPCCDREDSAGRGCRNGGPGCSGRGGR